MRHTYPRIQCALMPILAICAFALLATPAIAKDKVVQLRVLTPGGALTDNSSFVTGTESLKADRKAKCFFGGTGGSGEKVTLPGATALGTVISATDNVSAVNPVSVTDEFGFGLGVCGFGKAEADGNAGESWGAKVNERDLSVGGDQAKVRNGDTVTWFLAAPQPPDYAYPSELSLKPDSLRPGSGSVGVTVTSTNCSFDSGIGEYVCSKDPVLGAEVTGGTETVETDGDGMAMVEGSDVAKLKASLDGSLPARPSTVCFKANVSQCPRQATKIVGRDVGDDFRAQKGADDVFSHGGADRIDLRSGGSDHVNCGPGKDTVIVAKKDRNDKIARSCEKVIRRG
ncbi:hypothetical protein BH10ACT11_BH10ACT11_16860 [soil metagenome]